MNNRKSISPDTKTNSMDTFLNQSQEDEISRPESVEEGIFDVKADDLLHAPNNTSQEHSLDDTHQTLTPACLETEALDEAAEDAIKGNKGH